MVEKPAAGLRKTTRDRRPVGQISELFRSFCRSIVVLRSACICRYRINTSFFDPTYWQPKPTPPSSPSETRLMTLVSLEAK